MRLRDAYNGAMHRRIAAAGAPRELADRKIGDPGEQRVTGVELGHAGPQTNRALYGDLDVDLDDLDKFVAICQESARERVADAGGGRPARDLAAAIAGDVATLGLLAGLLKGRDDARAGA